MSADRRDENEQTPKSEPPELRILNCLHRAIAATNHRPATDRVMNRGATRLALRGAWLGNWQQWGPKPGWVRRRVLVFWAVPGRRYRE